MHMSKFKTDDEIESINKAIEIVKGLSGSEFVVDGWPFHKFPFGLWFRGQSCRKPLEPHVFRKIPSDASEEGQNQFKVYDETNLYEHLKLRVPQYHQTYRSAFDWLCLMQHYSLPTRLLDWSESILPALYFAAKGHPEEDGEIVVLNARRLNGNIKKRPTISTSRGPSVIIRAEMAATRSSGALRSQHSVIEAVREEAASGMKIDLDKDKGGKWLELYTSPIAVFPSRLNDRMIFQASVFTLHGGKKYMESMKEYYEDDIIPSPVSLEDIDEEINILRRYVIPSKMKSEIQENLFVLGIHEGTLFPEVDHQSVYLQQLWSYSQS
jgi:hypothetical protein